MKEIGGYFGLEQLIHKEYYPDLIAVNNARSALVYLIKARKIKKIYIPYFLCDSISNVCKREKCDYEYYHITPEFIPIFEKQLLKDEYLYVVNYYGQITNEMVLNLQNRYKNLILDNVQAFFQKPVEGIDTIYSCRKFLGVPDGGYVSTTAKLKEILPIDVSKDRMVHILGRFEGQAGEYYQDFKENDKSFATTELRAMSELTHNILGAINYERIINKRNLNYAVLNKELQSSNKLDLLIPVGPYVFPFYCENGLDIKKKLAEKKIFVATLWPNVLELEGTIEKQYAENILPLPIDQRYNVSDMKYVAEEVLKCIN